MASIPSSTTPAETDFAMPPDKLTAPFTIISTVQKAGEFGPYVSVSGRLAVDGENPTFTAMLNLPFDKNTKQLLPLTPAREGSTVPAIAYEFYAAALFGDKNIPDGTTIDTEDPELIGRKVLVTIQHYEKQAGKNKGKTGWRFSKVAPFGQALSAEDLDKLRTAFVALNPGVDQAELPALWDELTTDTLGAPKPSDKLTPAEAKQVWSGIRTTAKIKKITLPA